MLEIRKITRGGQLTLPKTFRDKYGIDVGDIVELIEKNNKLIIQPIQQKNQNNVAQKLISLLNSTDDLVGYKNEEELLENIQIERKKIRQKDENSN